MNDIGQRLRYLRHLLRLSQVELACDLGITKQAVSNMETGKSLPAISTLNKLLLDYNANINYLVSGVGEALIETKPDLNNIGMLRESILKDVRDMLKSRGIY